MAPGDGIAANKCKEFETTNERVTQATYLPGTFIPLGVNQQREFSTFCFKPLNWDAGTSL